METHNPFDLALNRLDNAIARLDRFNKLETRFLQLKRRGRLFAWGNRKPALAIVIKQIETLQTEIRSFR